MHMIPFNLYNHFLVNTKFHVFNLEDNFSVCFPFYDYVKSQIHFPLVVYTSGRKAEEYKEVYLSLTEPSYTIDKGIFLNVIRYFYRDIYSCLHNIGTEGDFILDLECLAFLGLEYESLDGDLNEKLLKLNKSSVSNDLILWR